MKGFRTHTILLLLMVNVGLIKLAIGQPSDTLIVRHRSAIKFSPFHLINFYPTIQFAYEYRLIHDISLQVDVGGVLPGHTESGLHRNMRGGKVKTEVRLYTKMLPSGKKLNYMAFELYYNHVDFDRTLTQTECLDSDCSQSIDVTHYFTVFYREWGYNLKAGRLRYISTRWFLDFNAGLSIRNIRYKEPAFIASTINQEWFNIPNESDRPGLRPELGLRVGYVIR